jgi:integrase
MHKSKLSPRTVNKYVEHVKQVVDSLKAPNGEPVHKRKWDPETMDLPIVEYSEQKRPSLKAGSVSELIQESSDQEQALYVLLAATGMRISEALGLETKHFINNGRTIVVEQQVEKDAARIVRHLKTDAAKREVDLHPDIAEYLLKYMTGKTGLLFRTANALSRRGWMRREWVGTHSNVSVRHGSAASVVWKTSTISGWLTDRKLCPSSTHTFTKSCSCDSMKLSESATDSLFRRRKKALLSRLSRNRGQKMQKKLQRKCRRILVVT